MEAIKITNFVEKIMMIFNAVKTVDKDNKEISKLMKTEFNLQTNGIELNKSIDLYINNYKIWIYNIAGSSTIALSIENQSKRTSYNFRKITLGDILELINLNEETQILDKIIEELEKMHKEKQNLINELKEIAAMLELLTKG